MIVKRAFSHRRIYLSAIIKAMEGTEEQEIQQPPEPQPEESLEGEITKEIETGKKPKKPRSEAQKAAFAKARKALAEKRALAKEEKKKPKPKPEPEPEIEDEPEPTKAKPKRKPKRKTVRYVESSSEDSSSSSEEEVVYVQRKKPQRKKKEPKAPRVIYVSDSDEDEYQQTPDINQLYSFV